jgi:hypothetical protein
MMLFDLIYVLSPLPSIMWFQENLAYMFSVNESNYWYDKENLEKNPFWDGPIWYKLTLTF